MSSTSHSSNADAFSFDRTVSGLKQGMESASHTAQEASQKAALASKDLLVFSQGNFEAVAQASQVFAAGAQDLFRQMAEAGQAAMQEVMSNMQAIASAKTVKDRIELQANLVRSTAVHAVTEGARVAQAGIDLAERVSNPLMARAVAAAETMTAPRA